MSPEELISIFDGLIERYGISLKINELPREIKSPIALDVEHDESGNFVGVGFTSDGVTVWYYSDLQLFRSIDFSALSLICHNGRTDFDCLKSWGINVKDTQLVWDTELLAHIVDSSRHSYGLKTLANDDCGVSYPSYDDIVGKRTAKQSKVRNTLDRQPLELVSKYNCMDCFVTYKLYERQRGSVSTSDSLRAKASQYFEDLERPVAFILQNMENRGICVNLKYLSSLKNTLENQKSPLEAEIKNQLGDINLNSPRQLLEALNAKEIYPTFKGKPSTDKRAFANIKGNTIIGLLVAFSEVETLLTSFVLPYLQRSESIVHPWFNQCGTRTGRLSCSKPNLLQIPKKTENGKKVRRMFIPKPGMLMGDCDFGQIEPRVLAHLSKDPAMCKMFNDGIDFHEYTALRLGIDRTRAKVLNLSVGYRATKYSVQRQLGGTHEKAQYEIDRWWALFPALRRWQDQLLYTSRKSGFISTLYGRRLKVDGLQDGNPWRREAAERQTINNVTQGSAAEIMKMAMIRIAREICGGAYQAATKFGLLVQVYDELLFEADSRDIRSIAEEVSTQMINAVKLDVPLTVDCKIGPNWADMEKI